MALLNDVLEQPLEPSYAAAAERRKAQGLPAATPTRGVLVVVMALLVGFLFAVAATNLRATTGIVSKARNDLIDQITARQARGDDLAAEVAGLQQQVLAAQASAVGGSGGTSILAELTRAQLTDGSLAVRGPGLVVTLDDASTAGSGSDPGRQTSGFGSDRVTAADLQQVVNGLWQSGAEAMSVNGQRLTSRSAIRFAGSAILVDFRPLTRPYVVTVIGDPAAMQTRFAGSAAGSYLKALGENYGIHSNSATADELTCPAGTEPGLVYARPEPTGIPSPSASPSATATTKATKPTTSVTPTSTRAGSSSATRTSTSAGTTPTPTASERTP
jgi:uncharacterized protein YlxW (UPF0749 family)